MVNLAGALAARGHRVDFVMGQARGHYLDEIAASVRVVDLDAPPAPRVVPSLLRVPGEFRLLAPMLLFPGMGRVLGAIPALARYLRRERPVAMLSALNYVNIAAILARRVARVETRTVLSVHNHVSASVERSDKRRLRALPQQIRRFFPEADGLVAVSRGVADDLAAVTGIARERIEAIYNPVVTPDIPARAREPLFHPWFATGEPPVVLGAGKLKKQKDFETLIRAFAEVRHLRMARLVILGDGPRRGPLLALARKLGLADDVEFPGFVANPFAFMARSGVFVLSSAWEGFGNVLVEAMACGCPVVSTKCPSGPSEILEDGRHGPMVPVGDSSGLAKAICGVLDAPRVRAALEERASLFSAAASAERYERVLLGDPVAVRVGRTKPE